MLFADLVGFTALSERLDPEDVAHVQDAYFGVVRETMERYGGQLEKFIGDAAMAVFGIPRTREDDAEHAVRAGLALAAGVESLSGRLGLEEGDLHVRVGVNTGEVAYAVEGPDQGRVTGDPVNVAARLQSEAPQGAVLLGDETCLAVAAAFELGPVLSLALKGKSAPVAARVAHSALPEASRERAMGSLRAPVVGRDVELAWLRQTVQSVADGRSALRLIVAPPGVGKSRLVRDGAHLILNRGDVQAVWMARVRPEASPFEPLGQLLREAAGAPVGAAIDPASLRAALGRSALLSPARADVVADALAALGDGGRAAPAAPPVAALGSTPGAAPATVPGTAAPVAAPAADGTHRAEQLAAWLDGFDALLAGRSVLWVVEDVHWAGPDLLGALRAAAARTRPGSGRLLILATARPSLQERPDAAEGIERLDLAPLGGLPVTELIRALVGDALPDALVSAIVERSDGNPLFVEELLRTWVAAGRLVRDEQGAWSLAAPGTHVAIPSTVQQIYAAQIDDLSPAERAVVRRGSVSGRRFPSAALPRLDVPDGAPAIARLVESGVVSGPLDDPISGDLFTYRHALLRDAGYASLSRAERARLHIRMAAWLEAAAGPRADEVADAIGLQYVAALEAAPALAPSIGDGLSRTEVSDRAGGWLERAADAELGLGAVRAAAHMYGRAVAHAAPGQTMLRARRLMGLGRSMASAADMGEAGEHLTEARDLYLDLFRTPPSEAAREQARDGVGRATELLGRLWCEQLRFRDAQALGRVTRELLGAGPENRPHAVRARLLMLESRAEHDATDADTSGVLDEARQIARAAGDQLLELEATRRLAVVRSELGLADPDGWPAVEALGRQVGDWGAVVAALINATTDFSDDDPARALPVIEQAHAIADARGMAEQLAWTDYSRAEILVVMGDIDGALAVCERALASAESNQYLRVAIRIYALQVPIALLRGDTGPAIRVEALWTGMTRPPDSPYARMVRAALDLCRAEAGLRGPLVPDPQMCLPALDMPASQASWLLAVERVVDAWLAAGMLDVVAEGVRRMVTVRSNPATSGLARATGDALAGKLALARGERESGAALVRGALDSVRSIPAPLWIERWLAVLEVAGAATPAEISEREPMRQQLGLIDEDRGSL